MPYKSKAQMRYMHVNHPEIAKRWDKNYKKKKKLPEKVAYKYFPKTAGIATYPFKLQLSGLHNMLSNSIKPGIKFADKFLTKLPKPKYQNPFKVNMIWPM